MLERLKGLSAGVEGVRASGRVTRDDYEKVLVPLLDEARHEGRRIRFLYQFGPGFEGLTPMAALEDGWIGLRHLRLFAGCAIVGDVGWINEAAHLVGALMPCPVRVFSGAQLQDAVQWLGSIDKVGTLVHRWIPELGVLVLEPHGPLRSADFDRLAAIVDPWIEAHGDLRGLVIHAPAFPGWENLAGLVGHVLFARAHFRRIRRIGLAVDGTMATLVPQLARHFADAEIKHFGFVEADEALKWVSASGGATPAATRSAMRADSRRAFPSRRRV